VAAGLGWEELAEMARRVFWPHLLDGRRLERFCARHLPETFADLRLPSREPVTIGEGRLASAISASCAQRVVRRPVVRDGERLGDGGIACVLPAEACRALGAELVIASDVWGLGWLLRGLGLHPLHPRGLRAYPAHYRRAIRHTDVLVTPSIPAAGYVPGARAVQRMITAGERAAWRELKRLGVGAV
ncbi:MAG TPA: hypothetical protein VE997_02855, partial [Candidatus Limnocylindria bacterium]|nr:hypothetical protein [Candidatus Limnocylindria bacterium]